MQEVIIKIKGDSSDIVKLGNELKNLGKIDAENAKQFEETNKKQKKAVKETGDEFKFLKDQISSLKSMVVGAFAIESIISFGKAMIDVTAEFQKYNAVLTNTLGTQEAATTAMAMIQEFASKTPFSVAELTDSFVKLVNQGFKPTMDQMTALGDIAASQGKSFDQLTEAIIDAQVGEFERLKEFGIRASKQGDQVAFTFKGVTTTVENTTEAMRNYIISLGQVEGVSGGMAKISETLGGKISNLGDNWDKLLYTLGNKSSGVFAGTIDLLNTLMDQAIMAAKTAEDIRTEVHNTAIVSIADEETKYFKEYIEKVRAATGATFDFNSARESYIKNIRESLKQSEWGSKEAAVLQAQLEAVYKIKEDPKVVEERIKKEKEEAAAKKNAAKATKEKTQAIEEQTNALQANYEQQQRIKKQQDETLKDALKIAEDIKTADKITSDARKNLLTLIAKQSGDQTQIENNEYKNQIDAINERYAKEIKAVEDAGMDATALKEAQYIELEFAEQNHQDKLTEITTKGAEDRKKTKLEEATATVEFTIGLGKTLVDAMKLQGKEAEQAQKAFALADIAISTARAIAALTTASTQVAGSVAAASGPAGLFTGPAAGAAFYATQIVTILANMLSAKQILGYEKGTASLQRNGHPAGVDTIPVMANEGEAIIPTDKNRQNPGLAAAWIKGNLDDYINVKYVIPALKRNKAGKDEDFANRLGKAISMNGTFNDMNLLESDKENRRILRSIDKTLKSSTHGLSRRKF